MVAEAAEVLRIIAGSIFVLFLPGFAWSYVFFKKNEIDIIERIALSFGLSIAIVPLTVFWLNYLFKVKITFINVSMIIISLTIVAVVISYVASKMSNRQTA
ncbi:MAG: DUF1616 domain-containing protein [Archaeoglobus sp.]|uniref:DUF1616 domain-containing protein n=1 Tax=Archaeoglobus sp. TaxID=1872626 RepID=UPI001DAA9248|nr:DUF1616 domain-containing protein [Archaeoglobus sp.]MBO8180448.1 DUF1616 domain-containing protein [Archaeoglobus sp.]